MNAETRTNRIVSRLIKFVRSEDGPAATEYAVMLALIIVTALSAIAVMGQSLFAWYVEMEAAMFA